jgi:hypothetical protein
MVKRVIILLIVLTLSAGTVWSQSIWHAWCFPNMAGLMAGLFSGKLTGVNDGSTNSESKSGIISGAFMNYPLGGAFSVQPEVHYVTKGVKKTHTYEGYEPPKYGGPGKIAAVNANGMTEKVSLTYIQIPVLFMYEIPVKGKLKPRVLLGPSLAFNISSKNVASGFGAGYDGEHDIGNLKKIDFSGLIGAGVSFPIGKLTFGLDVIYDRSLSSAFKDVTAEELANDIDQELWTKTDPNTFERTTEAVDFKNSGFSIQASVVLPIGKGKGQSEDPEE